MSFWTSGGALEPQGGCIICHQIEKLTPKMVALVQVCAILISFTWTSGWMHAKQSREV
jgi:hypothetical protein